MAWIVSRKNGSREIRWTNPDGERFSMYIGKMTKKSAEKYASKVKALADDQIAGRTNDPSLAKWLTEIPDKHHAKLAEYGLTVPRTPPEPVVTLGGWIKTFTSRGTWGQGTLDQITYATDNLTTFFDPTTPITNITPGDAEDFVRWLKTEARKLRKGETRETPEGLAHNTVRRRTGRAKELFAAAVKRKLIEENPFAEEIAATGANTEKHQFIPAKWIDRMIYHRDTTEDWRIMLAFARYAGMRSHETRIQKWADIDIPNRRMIVRSNKNPPSRVVPIFPELLPHLMRAKEMADDGAELVVTRYNASSNVLTTMEKLIQRAGLIRWPDLMQNLRRSRETELMAVYPIKDVSGWIGNSVPVAMKHYAMAMEDSFTRAIIQGANPICHPDTHPETTGKANSDANENQGQSNGDSDDTAKDERNAGLCLPVTVNETPSSYPTRT